MKSRSLATILSIKLAVMTVVLSIIVCIAIDFYVSKRMQIKIGNSLVNTAHHISNQLDQFMWSRMHELKILLALEDIQSGVDHNKIYIIINQLKESFPFFSWIGFTDTKGKVLAATDNFLFGQDISSRPVFKEGIRGRFIGDVHEAVLLAKLFTDAPDDHIQFVDISYPVLNRSGEISGVLAAHLNWEWAKELIETLHRSLFNYTEIFILSKKDNTVLLGHDDYIGKSLDNFFADSPVDFRGQWMLKTWPDGKEYLTGVVQSAGYDDYPGLGWIVLVRQPVNIAYDDISYIQTYIIYCGLLFVIIFIFLGYFIAKGITKPLNELAVAANHIRQGESLDFPKHFGIKEIESLKCALFNMVDRLNTSELAFNKMQIVAMTDPLTSLNNRASFSLYIEKCIKNIQEHESISVLYIDLDGFKKVNDIYGHHIGDMLLVEVSARLVKCVCEQECIFRIGGDEFVIILNTLRGVEEKTICSVGNNIIKEINISFNIRGNIVHIGCSIGCAIWPKNGYEVNDIIQKADKALYISKITGRNRLTFYNDISQCI